MLIDRARGDQTPVRILWTDSPDLSGVTAVVMRVYDDANRTTLIETLIGEKRGFDAGTWFPVSNPNWSGVRRFELVLTQDALETILPEMGEWKQD